MDIFQDKVIVVTGASEGIGRALCLALAPQKPKLVLAARNKNRLEQLKEEVESEGAKSIVVPTDVGEEKACKNLIERTISEFDRLDVLVNNAGRTMWTTLEDMKDISIIEQLMRINYFSAAYCTYYALPHIIKRVYPNFSNVLVSKITTFITKIAKVQFPPGGIKIDRIPF